MFALRRDGKRRWETLDVKNLNAALAARATREAALLTEAPTSVSAPAKRINVDDGIATYLTTVSAMRTHKTWLAYNLALNEFRKSCSKDYLDQIDKSDLTAFVVAQNKAGQDDRTVSNRVGAVVTFLRANGIVTVTLRHQYTERKVKAYSVEELRALNAASTDEELQIWQFFLGTGFREDEAAHACDTDIDFKLKTISVLEKPHWNWKPKDQGRTNGANSRFPARIAEGPQDHAPGWMAAAHDFRSGPRREHAHGGFTEE